MIFFVNLSRLGWVNLLVCVCGCVYEDSFNGYTRYTEKYMLYVRL